MILNHTVYANPMPKPFADARKTSHQRIRPKIGRFTIQQRDDGHFVLPNAVRIRSGREAPSQVLACERSLRTPEMS